jgi:hypothetical protein
MQTIGGGSNTGVTKDTIHDLNHLQVAAIVMKGVKHGTPTKKTKKG